jgi:hypothetical protein
LLRTGRELELPTLEQNVEMVVEEESFCQPYLPEADSIREAALATFDLMMTGTALRDAEWGEEIEAEHQVGVGATLAGEMEAASRSAATPSALTEAQWNVLEEARQMLARYRQQQDTRTRANGAEEAWAVARYSSTATHEEVKAMNRTRLAAQKEHDRAWHEYLATAQRLCRTVERLVELEAPGDAHAQ